MDFLLQSIQTTADILDGWTVGTLVIEDQQSFLQLEDGSMIPTSGILEVKNGDFWEQPVNWFTKITSNEGWPLYAGLRARMKQ